jgi:hypothetical protein
LLARRSRQAKEEAMKLLVAGIVGGVVLFLWGFVWHAVLPFGTAGMKTMAADKEAVVLEQMRGAMSERALYIFPGFDFDDPEAMESEPYKSRAASGPNGIVVFAPGPALEMGASTLISQLVFDLFEALVAAFLVANLAPSMGFAKRVALMPLLGVVATLMVDGSYWIWYRFPTEYFVSQLVSNALGTLFAGIAIVALLKPKAS